MLEEDLDTFVSGVFGQLTFINGKEIYGIFDENYDSFFANSSVDSEGRNITLLVRTDQVTNVGHRDEVIINNRSFSIVNIQPIDDGKMTNLILKEA